MDKNEAIKAMKAAGWVRHNGTETGDIGKSPRGKQHKVMEYRSIGNLSSTRSLNKWLREQDDYWVSPSGEISHWSQFKPPA